jgi:hypothetical protein
MTSAHMKMNAKVALKGAIFLSCLMAVANSFNLPARHSPPMRQVASTSTTALGLQRPHRWMFQKLRHIGKSPVVVNQSSLTLGQQGFVDDNEHTNGDTSIRTKAALNQVDTVATKAATVTSSTMNLIKVILGTGCLALPNGLAAVSDYPTS